LAEIVLRTVDAAVAITASMQASSVIPSQLFS